MALLGWQDVAGAVPAKQHLSWRSERLPLAHCVLAFCASLPEDPEKECDHIDANVSSLQSKQSSWLLSSRHMLTLEEAGGSALPRSQHSSTTSSRDPPLPLQLAVPFSHPPPRDNSIQSAGPAKQSLAWPGLPCFSRINARTCRYLQSLVSGLEQYGKVLTEEIHTRPAQVRRPALLHARFALHKLGVPATQGARMRCCRRAQKWVTESGSRWPETSSGQPKTLEFVGSCLLKLCCCGTIAKADRKQLQSITRTVTLRPWSA